MVNLKIEFNNRILTLPVNPENLSPERGADNETVNIIGLGNIVIKKEISLTSISIESFFPSTNSEFYTGVSPKSCVEFINNIWKSDKYARIISEGLPVNINMFFVIDTFNPDSRAGEEEDIYYTLELTEFKPYGAKYVKRANDNIIISSSNRVDTKPLINQIYTVKRKDSVISITKKLTGNASRWRELYAENTATIGNNPEALYVGQKLTLPESWVVR